MPNNSHEDIKVSVLCVAYNHEKYIREALESFVKQKTNFRYEVLIHDDASTDGTADIIREYAEKFPDIVKPVFQKENQYSKGGKIEFRFLFPRVKGKYVAFCEGDDYWTDEHKLQKQFDVMEQNPNCSICTHTVRCINEDGTLNSRTVPSPKFGLYGGLQDTKTVAENTWRPVYLFHTSSYFIRFDCISEYGNYDYANYLIIDVALLRTALNFGDFWYIDEEMSHWRLLSIGSWGSRMRSALYELRRVHLIDGVKGDFLYDKASGQKFHEYIIRCNVKKIWNIAEGDEDELHIPFKKAYDELLNEWGISVEEAFRNLKFKYRLKYFLRCLVPKLDFLIKRMPEKLKQKIYRP